MREERPTRDELLVRIDERVERIVKDVATLKEYDRAQNDKMLKVIKECAATTERSKSNYRLCCIAIGIGISAVSLGVSITQGVFPF